MAKLSQKRLSSLGQLHVGRTSFHSMDDFTDDFSEAIRRVLDDLSASDFRAASRSIFDTTTLGLSGFLIS